MIKNRDVSAAEVAKVSENLTEIPGVSVGTDWERSYPNGDSMRSVIGSVSSEQHVSQQILPDLSTGRIEAG